MVKSGKTFPNQIYFALDNNKKPSSLLLTLPGKDYYDSMSRTSAKDLSSNFMIDPRLANEMTLNRKLQDPEKMVIGPISQPTVYDTRSLTIKTSSGQTVVYQDIMLLTWGGMFSHQGPVYFERSVTINDKKQKLFSLSAK